YRRVQSVSYAARKSASSRRCAAPTMSRRVDVNERATPGVYQLTDASHRRSVHGERGCNEADLECEDEAVHSSKHGRMIGVGASRRRFVTVRRHDSRIAESALREAADRL